ncbi:MAG: primosomal protein N' [Bacteroidales bacterium]|nr:primosomal protein N' [Bacteroidales bacterium]
MPPDSPSYANVILPLAVPRYYTYQIPDQLLGKPQIGCRVTVVFGKRRIYSGIVRHLHNDTPVGFKSSSILSLLDDVPLVSQKQLEFWDWLSDYYMCTTGEVYRAALPSGLKLESETRIFPKEPEYLPVSLTSSEESLLDVLENNPGIALQKLSLSLGKKDVMPIVKNLIEKNLVTLEEKLKKGFQPKVIDFVEMEEKYKSEEDLNSFILSIEKKAPRQLELLLSFLHLSEFNKQDVLKENLLNSVNTTHAVLNALISKGVLRINPKEISRLSDNDIDIRDPYQLNKKQAEAYHSIKTQFESKDIVLLHGVTSSGKTEIYIHLIAEQIKEGKQVLYLLPEIALTAQIILRLKSVFGNKVGIYHSKFSDDERVEVYQNLAGIRKLNSPAYQIILGVRSSVFLPYSNLGLIIIDEEHENTYKQFDPAPRYNARDSAVVLARMHSGKVLMGTATPSFESYMNAKSGRYGFIGLHDRYLDIQLPKITVVDVRKARKKKQMHSHFSPELIKSIREALETEEQIILFQNRRGFSPYIECNACGWIPYCKNCDVSLTYHRKSNTLKCHYCGYRIKNPESCNSCGSKDIQTRGFGTEKIEDEITLILPGVNVKRMDLDTARTRRSHEKIISDFEHRKIDILIGTQMISKGLDFDHVRVVGIMNADNMLHFPDFRSYERSFQLIAQVSGRAGRKNIQGKVIIQTSDPENTVIKHVMENNFEGFFNQQLRERKNFNYPPYVRLVKLTLRHRKLPVVSDAANILASELRKALGDRVIGPEFPLINRLFNLHQKCIMIKIERDKQFAERRKIVRQIIDTVSSNPDFKSLQIIPDVDPMN